MSEGARQQSQSDLPPRPDPQSGEPFPPRGRGFRGGDRPAEWDRDRELRVSRKPDPPVGSGPVLVWHRESPRGKVTGAVVAFAILVVAMSVGTLLRWGDAFEWMTAWPVWLIVAAGTYLMSQPFTFRVYSAGADWFQLDVIRWGITTRDRVVRLYELTRVEVTYATSAMHLALSDEDDGVDLPIRDFQCDRRMWDLVYNGILHSAAGGARVNRNAWRELELDQVDGLITREEWVRRSLEPDKKGRLSEAQQVVQEQLHEARAEGGRIADPEDRVRTANLSDEDVREIMQDPQFRRYIEILRLPQDMPPERFRAEFPVLVKDVLPESLQ
ncbi:hypothetical protein SAMN06265360_10176 [Haloechinothrix alba]|uniref:Uncharacterized protein n=1 Tax=Haloechinothrix alba TaxID=664784 RepID=A0A238UZP1_9PSEU|nr:hypothetical protein [Haloechinothrix alba]SNR27486.1 hypothetical protein SAMN06265360_10176 [Haloechinothrix alba]